MSQDQDQKTEDKLQIECVFRQWTKPRKWLPFAQPSSPIRGLPFRFGLRIKNINNRPFSGATIHNWKIGTVSSYGDNIGLLGGSGGLAHRSDIEVNIQPLNPDESETLWIEMVTPGFDGPGVVSCDLRPADESHRISAFQKSTSGEPSRVADENHWLNTLYIEDRLVRLQVRSNQLILLLTAIIFIQGVWGLDKVSKWLFVTAPLAFLKSLVAWLTPAAS